MGVGASISSGHAWNVLAAQLTPLKTLYPILAVVGAVVPYIFVHAALFERRDRPRRFCKPLFTNPAGSGFTADLLITSSIFWVFMFQHKRGKGPGPMIFIVLNLLIGLSCAFPATAAERLVWGEGDGSTLTVVDAGFGKVGGLICWENLMPLAHMAMYDKEVEVYLAPTADARDTRSGSCIPRLTA